MYAHASLVHGYGSHIRENFLHHSLDVPGLVGRHAIQLDDHFGAISNCSHNVLCVVLFLFAAPDTCSTVELPPLNFVIDTHSVHIILVPKCSSC